MKGELTQIYVRSTVNDSSPVQMDWLNKQGVASIAWNSGTIHLVFISLYSNFHSEWPFFHVLSGNGFTFKFVNKINHFYKCSVRIICRHDDELYVIVTLLLESPSGINISFFSLSLCVLFLHTQKNREKYAQTKKSHK